MAPPFSHIHLRGIDIRWEGRDSTTPDGHHLANGLDSLGNHRLWLFHGDSISDDGYRGSVLLPRESTTQPVAYGPGGGYVARGHDTTALLVALVHAHDAQQDEKSELTGSEWVSRDGKRAVFVLEEAPEFRGDRMFRVRGSQGSGRERLISYAGLRKKYTRVEKERN